MTIFERCTASDAIEVRSSSKAEKVYTVSFRELAPTCTCVAFAIGKNRSKSTRPTKQGNQQAWCKHIEQVYDDACRWRGPSPMIPGMCPNCGGPTEQTAIAAFEMF